MKYLTTMATLFTARCNTKKFHILPTECIYVFCVVLKTNRKYFPIHHLLTGFLITEMECVYCAVRTTSLYATEINLSI
jgi:hypothetical protein